jgi:outer membrane protein assembly factor BamD
VRTFVVTALFAAAFWGCAGFNLFSTDDGANVKYAADADTNLEKGNAALNNKSYIEAQRYFDFVKSKYPYLEVAKTAELRLADTDFEREKYIEARDRYTNFVKLHPTHPKVDYAAYRAALTHYKEMPSDFFLLPPSDEKDQGALKAASVSLNDFIRSYPGSEWQAEAKKTLSDVRKRLAAHELYVASFYQKRNRWPAVINRLNTVAHDYPDLGLDEKVYFGLFDAYSKLADQDKAKEALRTLIAKAPSSDGAKRAQSMLSSMK